MAYGKVATDPVAIDAPGRFLFEWWSIFWVIFIARTNEKHSEAASVYIEAQQMKTKEQQLQILQQQNVQLQRGGGVLNHSTAAQKIQGRSHLMTDIKSEAIVGPTQNQLSVDPSSIYRQAILQLKSGHGSPVQKPILPVQNQYLMQAQEQVASHTPSQNTIGNSPHYGDVDPQRFIGLPKDSLNGKEAHSSRNEACSPMQSSSAQKVPQIQKASSQQPDQLPQLQLPQNNKKSKQASSSGLTAQGLGIL